MYGGASWSTPFLLDSVSSQPAYDVAMEGDGRPSVVWSTNSQVKELHPDGPWIGTVLSSSGAFGSPRVVMTDSGVTFASWCGSGGVMWGARRVHPNAWEARVGSLDNCCQGPALDTPGPGISLGVSASGEAVMVGGNATRVCEKRYVPALGGWQSTSVLATPGPDATAPQVAVSPDGHALVAWHNLGSGGVIHVRAYTPGSGWGPVLLGPSAGNGMLGLGIGSAGNGAVVYLSGPDVSSVGYDVSSGTLTAPIAVGSEPGTAYYLKIGFDPSESAQGVSTWQNAVGGEEIWAARLGL
jgi:hypothetical protein